MRLLFLAPILLAACTEVPVPPLSYARCASEGACGIGTTCQPVSLTTTGATTSLCTAGCVRDEECPGWSARCVPASDGPRSAARCFHGCVVDLDCRPGTVCRPIARAGDAGVTGDAPGAVLVCVPDFGPRPCARDEDCAPFSLRCLGEDAGAPTTTDRRCLAAGAS